MSDEDVEALRGKTPGLFVLPSRCLENELLYPPLLARALDMSGHQITEADIRTVLREIADNQFDQAHARTVDHILRRDHMRRLACVSR